MARQPTSLIDNVVPSQGMPLGGLTDEEIEVEEIEELMNDLYNEHYYDMTGLIAMKQRAETLIEKYQKVTS